jgi:dehydrogenase/reductase SDR family protein 7B
MKGKVVIVTGASSGIGKALAYEMASRGAHVVISARSFGILLEMEGELAGKGITALAVQADVSSEEDCRHLINATAEKFGRIDALINNAGISMRALFADTDLSVIHRLMDVNFWGTVNCTKFALPHLLKARGSVVGVSSIAGFKALPGRTGYSASKFAIHGFLETLRIENLKTGLHVMIVCPGFTASNIRKTALAADGSQQGESPRDEDSMMSAEEVARRITEAMIRRKKIVIMTTQGKMTVLMNKFFPFWMDKMVYGHMAKEPDSPFK